LRQYAAPEQLSSSAYSQAADLYPLGILLLELLHPMATAMEHARAVRDVRQGLLPPSFLAEWPAEVRTLTHTQR
jgi:serine/threonine protein kinase